MTSIQNSPASKRTVPADVAVAQDAQRGNHVMRRIATLGLRKRYSASTLGPCEGKIDSINYGRPGEFAGGHVHLRDRLGAVGRLTNAADERSRCPCPLKVIRRRRGRGHRGEHEARQQTNRGAQGHPASVPACAPAARLPADELRCARSAVHTRPCHYLRARRPVAAGQTTRISWVSSEDSEEKRAQGRQERQSQPKRSCKQAQLCSEHPRSEIRIRHVGQRLKMVEALPFGRFLGHWSGAR